ncbi:MAG: hypothetical protein M1816_001993 [Peltula sp. TS41687]|nr:MAG: hypothetical protein M1816_001993 [Peltula sp. TS41687]
MGVQVLDSVAQPQEDRQSEQASPGIMMSPSPKLHGRQFYNSIGAPRMILAPMVDQSEFAWRMLTRSYLVPGGRPPSAASTTLLAYTPMFHARMFRETAKYREQCFQPTGTQQEVSSLSSSAQEQHNRAFSRSPFYLDGNPLLDRPLVVQFCANDPDDLLAAAKHVEPFCDAVDLNLGCPQGIAKKGRYGAFLQDDWGVIYRLINRLHTDLAVPVTAKIRILETRERTLEYARMVISAGASILTVHGRQRHQKGHETGLADWSVIRYLRDNLPSDVVLFANGNILQHEDIEKCLEATGVDGVMSAEGNLYDPTIFAAEPPPMGEAGREYWRGRDGKGGYRMDAVMRRYLDIIHRYVLEQEPPERKPLFCLSDIVEHAQGLNADDIFRELPPSTAPIRDKKTPTNPNLQAMQAHLFHLLRPLFAKHTRIRDTLAKARTGDMATFEHVLTMVEYVIQEGLIEYEKTAQREAGNSSLCLNGTEQTNRITSDHMAADESSAAAIERCKRPWWICQPYVRPLPVEAIEKGALTLGKKQTSRVKGKSCASSQDLPSADQSRNAILGNPAQAGITVPKEGLVCG